MTDCASDFIQRQIDEAAVSIRQSHKKWPLVSGHVVLPRGVFHLRRPIRLRSGVAIEGASQASTILVSHLQEDEALFSSESSDELYAVSLRRFHAVATG